MQLCLFLGRQLVYITVPFKYLGKSCSTTGRVNCLKLYLKGNQCGENFLFFAVVTFYCFKISYECLSKHTWISAATQLLKIQNCQKGELTGKNAGECLFSCCLCRY